MLAWARAGIGDLALAGGSLFWTVPGQGLIESMAESGGTPLDVLSDGYRAPAALVVDNDTIYFSDDSAVEALPIGGGTPAYLGKASGIVGRLLLGDGWIYIATSGQVDNSVQRLPLAGGDASTLATVHGELEGMAVDETHVYFSAANGDVDRVPITGGDLEAVARADPAGYMRGIALDAGHVYWAAKGFMSGGSVAWAKSGIWRTSKDGGNVEALGTGLPGPYDILIDDQGLVWAGTDSIYARPLP